VPGICRFETAAVEEGAADAVAYAEEDAAACVEDVVAYAGEVAAACVAGEEDAAACVVAEVAYVVALWVVVGDRNHTVVLDVHSALHWVQGLACCAPVEEVQIRGALCLCAACAQIAHWAVEVSWGSFPHSLVEPQAVGEKQRPVASLFIFTKHKK
jgi:hypothetical protein